MSTNVDFVAFKTALFRARLTQRALAQRLGVRDNTISAWVRGATVLSEHQVRVIAKALRVKPSEIVLSDENQP